MTDVEKIYTVLELIEDRAGHGDSVITLSSMRLGREGLDSHDVREILAVLSTDEWRKCIRVVKWPDFFSLQNTDDGVYQVELLGNFYDIVRKYHEWVLYEKDPIKAAKLYPRNDLALTERDFAESQQDTRRIKNEVMSNMVEAKVIMRGKDVVVQFSNDDELKISRLQPGARPYNFMRFLLAHPDQDFDMAEIQASVEGCRSCKHLGELAGDCGFNKRLKNIFFPVSTKEHVKFTPVSFISQAIANTLTD